MSDNETQSNVPMVSVPALIEVHGAPDKHTGKEFVGTLDLRKYPDPAQAAVWMIQRAPRKISRDAAAPVTQETYGPKGFKKGDKLPPADFKRWADDWNEKARDGFQRFLDGRWRPGGTGGGATRTPEQVGAFNVLTALLMGQGHKKGAAEKLARKPDDALRSFVLTVLMKKHGPKVPDSAVDAGIEKFQPVFDKKVQAAVVAIREEEKRNAANAEQSQADAEAVLFGEGA